METRVTEKQKEWSKHIEQAKKEGISFALYCKREKLKASLMHYYAGRLRRGKTKPRPQPAFVEIKHPQPTPVHASPMVIHIGTQVRIEIPRDPAFLIALLRGLS